MPEETTQDETIAPGPESAPEAESEVTPQAEPVSEAAPAQEMDAAELLGSGAEAAPAEATSAEDARLKAILEAAVYVTEEPLTLEQLATALEQPKEKVSSLLEMLAEDYAKLDRGISIREVAGGYKMGTKPEHHEAIREFVKKMKPAFKLSLAALETLAVIAYKQPITAPEVQEIRGVQGGGVLKTLIDRKLIAPAGRKNVVGKPILYKTTKDFLVQFGLKDLAELPTLKEFEELRRLAFPDEGEAAPEVQAEAKPPEQEVAEPAAAAQEASTASQAS